MDPKRDVQMSEILPTMRPYCPCETMDSEVYIPTICVGLFVFGNTNACIVCMRITHNPGSF